MSRRRKLAMGLAVFVVAALGLVALTQPSGPPYCGPKPHGVYSHATVVAYECRSDGWYVTVESDGMGWQEPTRSTYKAL